jgi:hypothetical protein
VWLAATSNNFGILMMARKKRSPYAHSGKLFKLQTVEQIESQAENVGNIPTLDWFKETISLLYAAEQVLFEDNPGSDPAIYEQRVAAIRECEAFMKLVEKQSKLPQDAIGSQFLTYNAMQLAWKISLCRYRLLEQSAVDGMDQYNRAMELAESNTGSGFNPSRADLLAMLREAVKRYPGLNQKELCVRIANDKPVGGETIRKLLQSYKIRASEYKK